MPRACFHSPEKRIINKHLFCRLLKDGRVISKSGFLVQVPVDYLPNQGWKRSFKPYFRNSKKILVHPSIEFYWVNPKLQIFKKNSYFPLNFEGNYLHSYSQLHLKACLFMMEEIQLIHPLLLILFSISFGDLLFQFQVSSLNVYQINQLFQTIFINH